MKRTLWNCRGDHNFSEEDHMGILKAAARRHAGNKFERKMLRGALLRPNGLANYNKYTVL